jgi:hypothetical protein
MSTDNLQLIESYLLALFIHLIFKQKTNLNLAPVTGIEPANQCLERAFAKPA